MKITITIMCIMFSLFGTSQNDIQEFKSSIYDIKINSLSGEAIDLSEFKGKKILFVNTASECGFTSQYKGLQELHEKYKDKLVIIGLPCNQFGKQEPGNAEQIQSFCQVNYEVDFLMSYYAQDGIHAAVSGGIGTEKLTDITPTFVVAIPLNSDDVLTIDAGISAYSSASSSNIDPFDGSQPASPYSESSGRLVIIRNEPINVSRSVTPIAADASTPD